MVEELQNGRDATPGAGTGNVLEVDLGDRPTGDEPHRANRSGTGPRAARQDLLRTARRLRQGTVSLPLVGGLLVTTAAAAAMTAHAWDTHRQDIARRAATSLVATVDPARPVLTVRRMDHSGGPPAALEFDGHVMLANAGSLPVDLLDLRASLAPDAVLVRYPAPRHPARLPAGTSVPVPVRVSMLCQAWVDGEPLPLTVRVRTADGRQRTATLALPMQNAAWSELQFRTCWPVS